MKQVPARVVETPRGPVVERGYVEYCDGLRIYQDRITTDTRGRRQVSPGWCEVAGERMS